MKAEEREAYHRRRADEDEALHITKKNVCAVCGGGLITPYLYDKNREITIVCGTDPSHEGCLNMKSWYQKWVQGEQVPIFIANNLERKYGRKTVQEITTKLMVSAEDKLLLTNDLTELLAGFQDKDPDTHQLVPIKEVEVTRAIALVRQGFDPYNHLVIYHGKVSLNRDGVNWWANKTGVPHRVVCKPVPKDERDNYGVKANEIGVIAELYVRDEAQPRYSALGRASKVAGSEVIYKSKVESKHPFDLAQKRAEVKVVKKWRPVNAITPDEYEEAAEIGEEIVETIVEEEPGMVDGGPVTVVDEKEESAHPGDSGYASLAEAYGEMHAEEVEPEMAPDPKPDARLKPWNEIKKLIAEKNVGDVRVRAWFGEAYGLEISKTHFEEAVPGEFFNLVMLQKFLKVMQKAKLEPKKPDEIPF